MRSKEIENYKRKLKLTKEQREVLVGILLGDAHLETQDRGRTYRLKVEQSSRHKDYVFHLYELFRDWVLTPPQPRVRRYPSGREKVQWWFQTVSHGAFRFYAHQFYRAGRKTVPRLIHRWLKPRSLAYWFMDNGSIKWSKSRAVVLHTHSFKPFEIKRLMDVLTKMYGLEVYRRKQKDGYQIVISRNSLRKFVELIRPFILTSMLYKLPKGGRTQMPKE